MARRGRRRRVLGLREFYGLQRRAAVVQAVRRMHRKEITWRLIAFALGIFVGWLLATAYVYENLEGILK